MFLLHHAPKVTLNDLVKFDMSSKDLIMKRENVNLWKAVNQLGDRTQGLEDDLSEVQAWQVSNSAEVRQ